MQDFVYNVAVPYTPEDNESYAQKRTYLFKTCDNINPVDCSKLWSFQKCANDEDYLNPFVSNSEYADKIFIQFPYDASKYKKIIIEIINSATGLPVDPTGIVTTETGVDTKGTTRINIIIDTAVMQYIGLECFYFNTYFFDCDAEEDEDYETCYNAKIEAGTAPYTAEKECYQQICGPDGAFLITSEGFRHVKCEDTILIHGYYPSNYDCNGNYYSPFVSGSTTNSFIPQIRVYGEIFWTSDQVEETIVNRQRIRSRRIDTYRLRTLKIPPYVAQMIATCFNAQLFFVDTNSYKGSIKLDKNFDEGKMWIIDTTVFSECNEIDFTCD